MFFDYKKTKSITFYWAEIKNVYSFFYELFGEGRRKARLKRVVLEFKGFSTL